VLDKTLRSQPAEVIAAEFDFDQPVEFNGKSPRVAAGVSGGIECLQQEDNPCQE
jgi:hypothetical protein